jgi:hypothetical protein
MASLKITTTDGETTEQRITPAIEFAFEQHHKIGFHKAFREREQQSDLYWLDFVATLESVEVVEDSDPK